MRRSLLVLCSLSVLSAVANAGLPHSAISNGSFDADLGDWLLRGSCASVGRPSHVQPEATPFGGAVLFPDDPQGGCYLQQPVTNVTGQYVVSWRAKVLPEQGVDTPQGIALYGSPSAPILMASLWTDRVEFRAFGSAYQTVNEPFQAGTWHHYVAILDSTNATATLLLDGVPVAITIGTPTRLPDHIWFGDGDNYPTRLNAPDVLWDELYVGPFP